MSVTWVNAAALAGVALIALPIAIHLLVRQQTRVLAYPSLRFLRETTLAAFRRRAIQDAALLACRIGIIAAAVAALAGPIVQTRSRTAAHAARVSRAVIAVEGAPTDVPGDAFRTATFERRRLADAIADAIRWLDAQPPSAREIVFTGSFRRGSIDAGDLSAVPAEIGLRMIASAPEVVPARQTASRLTRRNGVLVRVDQELVANADATRVTEGEATPVPSDRVRVLAADADRTLAEAALLAALDEGIPWTAGDRHVVLVWQGADESRVPASGVDVIRMPVPTPASTAASATWHALVEGVPVRFAEPVSIAPEQLAAWSRPAGLPSPNAVPADEGDRRWLWAAAIALLALEHVLRRESAGHRAVPAQPEEARVA